MEEGMVMSWQYESNGQYIYNCTYTLTADSTITAISENAIVKRLVVAK